MISRVASTSALVVTIAAMAGCGDDGGGGSGGGSSSSGTGGSGGEPGAGGGNGGLGGLGVGGLGGGSNVCEPRSEQPCYSGPIETERVGICTGGTETCAADGSGFGACEGEVLPGVEQCATLADEDCDGATPPCPVAALCSRQIGGSAFETGRAIAVDTTGSILITGQFQGTVDFGGGPLIATNQSVYVVKLDPSCNHVWSKKFEPTGPQSEGMSIATDTQNNVIVGGMFFGTIDFGGGILTGANGFQENDMFVLKLDASGNHVWSQRFGDSAGDQYAWGITTDAANNVIMTGNLPGSADFGGGVVNGFGCVAKFDATGAHVFSKGWSGGRGRGVAADADGNIFVAGELLGTVDFGGGALTNAGGGSDLYVAKFEPDGDHLWSAQYVTSVGFQNNVLATDVSGNVFISGAFETSLDFGGGSLVSAGGSDVFLAKLDPLGAHLWSQRHGDAQSQGARGVATDLAGNVGIGGDFGGTLDLGGGTLASAGARDAFAGKRAAAGAHVWSTAFGDPAAQSSIGVAFDPSGNLVVLGEFEGTIDLGSGAITSVGSQDLFIVKLPP